MNCNSNTMRLRDIENVTLDTCTQSCTTLPINLVCNNLIVPPSEFILANQYNNHSNKKSSVSCERKKFSLRNLFNL